MAPIGWSSIGDDDDGCGRRRVKLNRLARKLFNSEKLLLDDDEAAASNWVEEVEVKKKEDELQDDEAAAAEGVAEAALAEYWNAEARLDEVV